MRNAVLHIGTEKTGSTSIQDYLFKQGKWLNKHNFTYIRSAGLISNFRLVAYCMAKPNLSLLKTEESGDTELAFSEWKRDFALKHFDEVSRFQREKSESSTVIYSSEHFHSRVIDEADISELKSFLDKLYDSLTIVVYLRRQDRLAISAHNTAVQGGMQTRLNFQDLTTTGAYYDYEKLLDRWSSVFQQAEIKVRIFEPDRLAGRNVVTDFCNLVGVPEQQISNSSESKSNERLSFSAQEVLLKFNKLDEDHPVLLGHTKPQLRQVLIRNLHGLEDNFGTILPSRSDAEHFYEQFRERNEKVANAWLDGKGFDDSFTDYPEVASEIPEIDSQAILEKYIGMCNP